MNRSAIHEALHNLTVFLIMISTSCFYTSLYISIEVYICCNSLISAYLSSDISIHYLFYIFFLAFYSLPLKELPQTLYVTAFHSLDCCHYLLFTTKPMHGKQNSSPSQTVTHALYLLQLLKIGPTYQSPLPPPPPPPLSPPLSSKENER